MALHVNLLAVATVWLCATAIDVHAAELTKASLQECSKQAGPLKGSERGRFMLECLGTTEAALEARGAKRLREDPCGSGSAIGSIECRRPSWDRSELELSQSYIAIRNQLKNEKLQHLERRLVAAQREWVKFREEHCAFEAAMQVEGNLWNSYYLADCKATEADRRAEYLRGALR